VTPAELLLLKVLHDRGIEMSQLKENVLYCRTTLQNLQLSVLLQARNSLGMIIDENTAAYEAAMFLIANGASPQYSDMERTLPLALLQDRTDIVDTIVWWTHYYDQLHSLDFTSLASFVPFFTRPSFVPFPCCDGQIERAHS
jgi:hypothetical protein